MITPSFLTVAVSAIIPTDSALSTLIFPEVERLFITAFVLSSVSFFIYIPADFSSFKLIVPVLFIVVIPGITGDATDVSLNTFAYIPILLSFSALIIPELLSL